MGSLLLRRVCGSSGGYSISASPSADLALGNSVAANGWSMRHAFAIQVTGPAVDRVACHPYLVTHSDPFIRDPRGPGFGRKLFEDSYLVDSASSHMLVSKIKPCMSKYKQLYGETANGSLNQLSFI